MRRILGVGSLLLLAVATACGRSDLFEAAESPRESIVVARYSPPATPVVHGQGIAVRRLIRTVDLDLAVDDTATAAAAIRDLTSLLGGYVAADDAQQRGGVLKESMTLHVPADQLDVAVARISGLAAEVRRQHLRTEDVTDRIIDVDARLLTLRATETELRALLEASDARAGGLEDIMAVYRELTRVRGEIEQHQAQLESLQQRVALATINLSLQPLPPAGVAEPWSPVEVARRGAATLVDALQALATLAIYVVIVVLPVSLLIALPTWGAVRLLQQKGRL
jgi:hypothetical protein